MLDLWQHDTDIAASPQPGEAHDLPATFGDTFESAWNEGRLFTQSLAGENARMDALSDQVEAIRDKTGKDITPQIDWSGYAEAGAVPDSYSLLGQVNDAAKKLGQPELSNDDLDDAALRRSRAAETAYAAMAAREKTAGGSFGMFLGGAAAQATDPINLVALPIAPETGGVGVLGAALRWGALAGVAQGAIEATGGAYREAVEPGYFESGAPLLNTLGAAAQGAVLGGGLRALGNLWTRVKTGAWPQSVRDAGNVVESEANIAATNVYPGAGGEAAHRQALSVAIDHIISGRPVDVSDIITPELEAQSRNLMMRLEGDRGFLLPIFDERSIRLTSEEAQLREQDARLAAQVAGLPEGDLSAADRLNRLQAVEQQIASASDQGTRRSLTARRDQILVDTTPEALQAGAAPIAQRRSIEAQRGQIAQRLAEIQTQRGQIEADNLGRTAPMLGQTMPVRGPAVDDAMAQAANKQIRAVPIMQARALSARLADEAQGTNAIMSNVPQPELPFAENAAVARMRQADEILAGGVQQIARRAGYEMPDAEAASVAAKLIKAEPADADDMLRDLQVSPRQVADAPTKPATIIPQIPEPVASAEKVAATAGYHEALRADIDRERATGDLEIPVDLDKDGNPIKRSVDAAMDEIDAYKQAAEQLAACAAPAPEAAEAEAA